MDLALRHEIERLLAEPRAVPPYRLLNELLVDFLKAKGFLQSDSLAEAMQHRPRHQFLEGHELRLVYSDRAVTTVGDDDWFLSSCSTPSVTISMIEALDLQGGERVLEIGGGTGYAAALLAESARGVEVVSLECIEDEARHARSRLESLTVRNVDMRIGDGSETSVDLGEFDAILVSCGLEEVPERWIEMLRPGGRIVASVGKVVHRLDLNEDGGMTGRPLFVADFVPYRESDDPAGTVSWERNGDVAVWWPGRAEAPQGPETALEDDPAARTAGPVVPASCLHALSLALSARFPAQWFQFVDRNAGWGFGLVSPGGDGFVLCRASGAFLFRHYPGQVETPIFEVHGDDAPADEFFAELERLGDAGPPMLDDLQVELRPAANQELGNSLFGGIRGSHVWRYQTRREQALSLDS